MQEDKICEERHSMINEKLKELDNRVDKLEQNQVSLSQDVKYISKYIENMVSLERWKLGIIATTAISIIGFLLQKVLFK